MTEQELDAKVARFKESTIRTAMSGLHSFRAYAIVMRAKMDEKGVIVGSLKESEVEDGGEEMEDIIKGKVAAMGALLEKLLKEAPKSVVMEAVVLSKLIAVLADLEDPEKALRRVLDETFEEAKAKRVGPYDPAIGNGETSLADIMGRFAKSLATDKPTQPPPKGGLKN